MKLIYEGKTKNVFDLENGDYLLKLKDDATGKDGVFDPGENAVGLSILGLGRQSLRLTKYYFEMLRKMDIPTHYLSSDLKEVTMTVKPAKTFGNGLEFICRYRAVGSFFKRYGQYVEEGKVLDTYTEVTLKDDQRQDPTIDKDALKLLNIMTKDQYKSCKKLTKKIAKIIKKDLGRKSLELYDIKLEFGIVDGKVALIDEISGGNMRVYKDDKIVDPMNLVDIVLGEYKEKNK